MYNMYNIVQSWNIFDIVVIKYERSHNSNDF